MVLFLWPTIWDSLGSINVGKNLPYIDPIGDFALLQLWYMATCPPGLIIPFDLLTNVLQKLRLVSTLGEERLGGLVKPSFPAPKGKFGQSSTQSVFGMGMGYGTAPSSVFSKLHLSLMASEPGGWSNGWRESEAKHIPDFFWWWNP